MLSSKNSSIYSSTLTLQYIITTLPPQFSAPEQEMDSGLRSRADGSSKRDEKRNGIKASVMKFMKARSLWPAAIKVKKTQPPYDHENDTMVSSKVLTLEDLIMSSPAFNSNWIHPSFDDGQVKLEELLYNFTESLSLDVEMKDGEAAHVGKLETSSSFRAETMKGGRMKKRVSFRSPVIADVFVLSSPAIYTV